MNNRLLVGLIAATVGAIVALGSPVLARGGFGGGGHGGVGHIGAMGVGAHFGGGMAGPHFGGAHFGGAHFAGAPMAHAAFAPRGAGVAFHGPLGFHHHGVFRHHRFHRFAFIGTPYYAGYYDSCWRRLWTAYGPRWVNVCGDWY